MAANRDTERGFGMAHMDDGSHDRGAGAAYLRVLRRLADDGTRDRAQWLAERIETIDPDSRAARAARSLTAGSDDGRA